METGTTRGTTVKEDYSVPTEVELSSLRWRRLSGRDWWRTRTGRR